MSTALPTHAQSPFVWDGGDGSSLLWSAGNNWNPDIAPANNFLAPFTFSGSVNTGSPAAPLTNDLTAGVISNLTFSAGAGSFYIAGNSVTNAGNITNASGVPQTLTLPMVLSTNFPTTTTAHIIDVGSGSITNGSLITAPVVNSTSAKLGSGTLYFNSPYTNVLGNGTPGGTPFVPAFYVDSGTVIFDGGPTSVYNLLGEGAFGRAAPTGNSNVTVILQSGTLSGNTWIGIGRGNGVGDVSANLILNGSSVFNPVNWSGCFNAGDGTRRPRGTVTHNGTSLFFINNNNANNNFAESTGSYLVHTLNDSSTLQVGNGTSARARIGISGRCIIRQTSPTATIIFNQTHFGDAIGGAGAVYNRGIFKVMSPASIDHFGIGSFSGGATPANNGYGYYLHDSTTPVGLNEIGIGGQLGGDGVLEVKQGTVYVTNWITVCRRDATTAGAAQSGLLLIRNGTVVAPNVEQFRYIWTGSGVSEYGVVDVASGGKIASSNGPNSAIDLANSANALSFSTLTLGTGGTIEVGRIFASQGAPLNIVNFNGGTLSPTKSINGFLGNNLDAVYVYSGGVTFDTKGFDITINPQLQAPNGSGITSIPVATPGAGYIGRPIVRISDPSGAGATAIAEWNEASGTITGITITCPGSAYSAPTIALVGGGFTNAATLGTPVLGTPVSGGLTKTGAGMLTLSGGATYTGPTLLNGGTLSVNPATIFPVSPSALTVSNAILTVDASSGNPLQTAAFSLDNNTVINLNYGTVSANPFNPAINATGLTAPGANIVLNVTGFGFQVGTFTLLKYAGTPLANLNNFVLGPLPPGVVATLVNNTGNTSIDLHITSAGQNLVWSGYVPDLAQFSSNWDITITTNWVSYGTTTPARYQEYTTTLTVGDPVRFDDTLYNDFVNPPVTNIYLSTTLRPFIVTVDSTLNYILSGPGGLAGISTLVKSNISSLIVATSNSNTGGTLIYGGSVVITNDSALGAPTAPLTMGGGTLLIEGSMSNTHPTTVNAASTINTDTGVTAQLGGAISGTSRLIFDGNGTKVLTNRGNLAFHVNNGTLILDRSANFTNNLAFTSIPVGNALNPQNGRVILRSNAVLEISVDLNIADFPGNNSIGRLDIQDSAVLRTLNLWIGKGFGTTGTVYQTGGLVTNHVTGGSDLQIGGSSAADAGAFGGYYLSGGSMGIRKNFQIGTYGYGEFIMNGGTFNSIAGFTSIGRYSNSVGVVVVSGGQFNQTATANSMLVGENGTGTLVISNTGIVSVTNALRIGGGGGPPGNGTVILATGGKLVAPGLLMPSAGSSVLNFNGGTLQANASSTTFMQTLTAANILAGGANIDTGTNNITIGQPLLNGGGGGGLTKLGGGTVTLTGADTYSGTTLVSVGRLLVSPAHQVTGAVTVSDSAKFGVFANGPGTANIGALTIGTVATNNTLDFVFTTGINPAAPVLQATSLAVNGICGVRLAGLVNVGTFPLVKYSGAIGGTGTFTNVIVGPQGVAATLSNDVAGATLYVVVTSVGAGLVWSGTNSVLALTNLWDLNSTTNWLAGSTRTLYQELFAPGDPVTFNDVGSGVVLLNAMASPASIVFDNNAVNYSLSGTGRLSGITGLVKRGSGAVTLSLAGNDYTGNTVVSNGLLRLGSATTIPDGAGFGNLVLNSPGSMDLVGFSETINGLSGSGSVDNSSGTAATFTVGNADKAVNWSGSMNSSGAGGISLTKVGTNTIVVSGTNILRSGTASQINGGTLIITNNGLVGLSGAEFWIAQNAVVASVIVDGGTLVTSNNWLAIGRNNAGAVGTLTLNHGKVIKAGANNIVLGSLGATGTLIVNGGQVLNNGMLWLGENNTANGYLHLNGGLVQATQVRPNGTAPLNSIAYFNGGTLQASAASADFIGSQSIIQAGGLVLDDGGFAITLASQPLQEDSLSPGGGLIKTGSGTVYLDNAANNYVGLTLITNGMLAGTGNINGPVQVSPTGAIGAGAAGTNVGTLMLNTQPLVLQGNASFRIKKTGGVPTSDQIAGITTVTYGGTLSVNNISTEALTVGDRFYLFSAGVFNGAFSGFNLASAGPGLGWSNRMSIDGSIEVVSSVVVQPVITGISVSGGNIVITGTNGTALQQYRLMSSTNMTLPLANWTGVFTNSFSGSSFSITIPVVSGEAQRYYRVSIP